MTAAQIQNNQRSALGPGLQRLLAGLRLDLTYTRASGNRLHCKLDGRDVEVLDMIGGYGATLLGHNHPELIECMQSLLRDGIAVHAQGSVRAASGKLAARLCGMVSERVGGDYVATLLNTGTEAVEAAIKHAYLETTLRYEQLIEKRKKQLKQSLEALHNGQAVLAPDAMAAAERVFGAIDGGTEGLAECLRTHELAQPQLGFIALRGAFHGKTVGSLALTSNELFRAHWDALGPHATFIDLDDPRTLEAVIADATLSIPSLVKTGGVVRFEETTFVAIAGCIVEPIQGEGGIREITSEQMRRLRESADEHGYPLILDEIQCGLGRCGSFLASETSGVRADYYLFSKALGGGLVKISALLIDRARYCEEFGQVHTSTFALDDLSSRIADKTLELLSQNGGALIERCAARGRYLLQRFEKLRQRFPNLIADVRGRGLMCGLELACLDDSPSPLLRVLSDQHMLGFVASAYLLHRHHIRVAPTLSSPHVLRFEPSALIEVSDLDRVVAGLQELLSCLEAGHVEELTSFIALEPMPTAAPARNSFTSGGASSLRRRRSHQRRVGFLAHFPNAADLRNWEPRLAHLGDGECKTFLDRTEGLIEPFMLSESEIVSSAGERIVVDAIGVPFTSEQALRDLRAGTKHCLRLVQRGIAMAEARGCDLVGLGGHTSIVADGGRAIGDSAVSVTTGNGLTVAAALETLLDMAAKRNIQTARASFGVVGAAGNIGAVMASLGARHVQRVVLFGRPGTERFLRAVADGVYADIARRLARAEDVGGIGEIIARSRSGREQWRCGMSDQELGRRLRESLERELKDSAPVAISTQLEDLRECQLIATTTNSPQPIITAQHLRTGPVVISDIAVPSDVAHDVSVLRPNCVVLRGGVVGLPFGQQVRLPGAALPPGHIYGCLAETLVLGLSNSGRRSYGALTAEQVLEVGQLAHKHGFRLVLDRAAAVSGGGVSP